MEYITIFGSARERENGKYYSSIFELATALSKCGYGIVTGSAGGIMEAANKGAFLSGGVSVGINVVLPNEQTPNPYLTKLLTNDNLSHRKNALIEKSAGFVIAPGGFGTLDELFEVMTLTQTGLRKHKIVFWDSEFWSPLFEFFKTRLLRENFIKAKDLELYMVCDEVEKAVEYLKK